MFSYRVFLNDDLVEQVNSAHEIDLEQTLPKFDPQRDLYVASKDLLYDASYKIQVRSRVIEKESAKQSHFSAVYDGRSLRSQDSIKEKAVNIDTLVSEAKGKLRKAVAAAASEAEPGPGKKDRSRPRPQPNRMAFGNPR